MNGYGCSFIYIIIDIILWENKNNNDSFVVQLISHALPGPVRIAKWDGLGHQSVAVVR